MTIRRGVTAEFENQLFLGNHDFASQTFKLALYTNDAVLNTTTTQYSTDNEIAGWSGTGGTPEYEAGGVSVTTSVGTDEHGSFVDVADVTFGNVPADTVFRAALLYNTALSANNAVLVIDFGQDIQTPNGEATLLFSNASRGHPLLRIHTAAH